MPAQPLVTTCYYPESDGKPMGETDWHRKAIMRLIMLLERHFTGQKVYVSGDLLMYYEQGNPKKFIVPDVFVVKDLLPKDRRIYRLWIEQKIPNAIIEVTSRKTRKKDAVEKPKLYRQFGVPEYFLFDPDSDYLDPPLQGYRLGELDYERILPDADGALLCQELELKLKHDETGLNLFTLDGRKLLTGYEEADRLQSEAERLQEEADRLAEENRCLREELARRKATDRFTSLMDEQYAIDVLSGKRRGLWPSVLRGVCEAASWGYAAAMAARNTAYDRDWLTRYRAGVPVISVGNLTTGGTGKTPVTAYLAAELMARGYRPGIVSRGYRQLDDRQNDEQMVLSQLLPDVPQIMNRDRVAGATDAVLDHDCNAVLLDDGFQHRRLARDLDLVLIDATRPWGFGRLLPRGLLREPRASLERADLVLITRCDQVPGHELEQIRQELQRYRGTPECVEIRFAPRRLRSTSGEFRSLAELANERPLAFCGIGNPTGFQRLLAKLGVICAPIAFADHHHYGPVNFRRLALSADAMQATCYVTTQKDQVKLPGDQLAGRPVWAVEIAAEIVAGGELLMATLNQLPQRVRRAA